MYLIISASPNSDGLTAACARAALAGVREAGATARHLDLCTMTLERCRQCGNGWGRCLKEHVCVIEDDLHTLHKPWRQAGVSSSLPRCIGAKWRRAPNRPSTDCGAARRHAVRRARWRKNRSSPSPRPGVPAVASPPACSPWNASSSTRARRCRISSALPSAAAPTKWRRFVRRRKSARWPRSEPGAVSSS